MDFLGINKVKTRKYSLVQRRLHEMGLTRRKRERDEILTSRWRAGTERVQERRR